MILEDKILDMLEGKSKITEGTLEPAQAGAASDEQSEKKEEGEGNKPKKSAKKGEKAEKPKQE